MDTKEVLINKRPALILALSVLLSLLISTLALIINVKFVSVIILVVVLAFALFIILFIKNRCLNGVVITILILVLSLIVSVITVLKVKEYNDVNFNGKYEIEGVISNISENYIDNGFEYKNITLETKVDDVDIKVKIPIDASFKVYFGNIVKVRCKLSKIDVYYDGKLNATNLSEGVFYIGTPYYYEINDKVVHGNINKLKFKLLKGLKDCLPYHYGIAYAMLTGETSYMDGELLDNFRYMGIAHIFAVSGLHVAFLYSFLSYIFKITKLNKNLAFIFKSIILFLYIWFCGFSPSCLRAFIIVFMLGFANLSYLKPDRLTLVCFAFIVAVIANPFDFYTIGFKLSFTVYSAIVFFSKPCQEVLEKVFFERVAKYISPYLVAFFSSLPLLVDSFGFVSLFSMLFNMAFVPILGLAYILTFILAISIFLLPFYEIFAIIPNLIFSAVIYIINLLKLDLFMITNIKFLVSKTAYYITFIGNSGFFNLSKRYKTIFTIISSLAFISLFIYVNLFI